MLISQWPGPGVSGSSVMRGGPPCATAGAGRHAVANIATRMPRSSRRVTTRRIYAFAKKARDRELSRRLCAVGERDEEREAILRAARARDVALARRVFRQQDVPRTEPQLPSALELDFALAAERDDELASPSGVPIEVVVLIGPAELKALHRHGLRQFGAAALRLERDL